jgi:tRNA threonylcarbamoyladenosine biosynthesis protein TsaE
MEAAGEPLLQARFGGAELAIGNAHLLEAQLDTPALDVAREPCKIRRVRFSLQHRPHSKVQLTRFLPSEADTLDLGRALSEALEPGLVIYMVGDLGAGKTTLARGILRGLGYTGRVKSPTFTLVELYKFSRLYLYHFDFYRFDDPQELADAGFREYFAANAVCLVEWPEKATGLPAADVRIELRLTGKGRTVELSADTEAGRLCLTRLQNASAT